MKWDLIIFDCDGVLVDSEAIGNRFIAEALTALGIETSPRCVIYACVSKYTIVAHSLDLD